MSEEKNDKPSSTTKFQKGRTPWNKGRKCPRKPNEGDQDDGTVKINIIKGKKPMPQKTFEGRLEDVKERTAISFIRSVIANKPKSIDFDGMKYYSEEVTDRLEQKLWQARQLNSESDSALKRSLSTMKDLVDVTQDLEKTLRKTMFTRNCWRAAAIGFIIATVIIILVGKMASKSAVMPTGGDSAPLTIEQKSK